MRNSLFFLLLLFSVKAASSTSLCSVVFDDKVAEEQKRFLKSLPDISKPEWEYAEAYFREQRVDFSFEKVNYIVSSEGVAVRILPTQSHPLNRFAKDILERHGADLIYVVGNRDPSFIPVVMSDKVTSLKISLPIEILSAPVSMARTFAGLHELRHLTDYLSTFKGEDTAFIGRISSLSKDLEVPGDRNVREWGYERGFGFSEIRTHYSQLYQQALRLSLRLKQGDMSAIEVKERFESVAKSLDMLNILVDRTNYSLSILSQQSSKSLLSRIFSKDSALPHTVGQLQYGPHLLTVVEISVTVGTVPVVIDVPLSQLKANQNPYDAAIEHLQWTLSASQFVEASLVTANHTLKTIDIEASKPQELRKFLDSILNNVSPGKLAPYYK